MKKTLSQAVQGVLDLVMVKPQSTVVKLGYQTRLKRDYGYDPLRCQHCGAGLWLWQIWHPDYGVIYDEGEAIKAGKYERPFDPKPPVIIAKPDPVSQLALLDLQLPTLTYA